MWSLAREEEEDNRRGRRVAGAAAKILESDHALEAVICRLMFPSKAAERAHHG